MKFNFLVHLFFNVPVSIVDFQQNVPAIIFNISVGSVHLYTLLQYPSVWSHSTFELGYFSSRVMALVIHFSFILTLSSLSS